jgi:GNAT superfamily N-acetyltransferase
VEPTVRGLRDGEWSAAAGVAARAMWDEPYLRLTYGDDPVHRFAATHDLYETADLTGRLILVAVADGEVVGVVAGRPPGTCVYCRPITAEELASDDPMDVAFRRVDARARDAHRSLEAHWYLAPLAVEPVVQGAGLGRRLMDAFHEVTAAQQPEPIVLECAPHVRGFYEGLGYDLGEDISADGIELRVMVREP